MTAPHQSLLGTSGAVAEEETDAEFNQTVLLLHGDGTNGGQNNTFVDSSTNNLSITSTGTPTQGTFNPFLGDGYYSVYSDSTDDGGTDFPYYRVTEGTDFDLNGQFSVECWFYAVAAMNWGIFITGNGGTDLFQIAVDSSDTIDIRFNGTTNEYGGYSITRNVWTHFLITRDSSNYIRSFLNGVLKSYDSNSGTPDLSGIDFISRNGDNPFIGYLTEFRFINGSIPTSYQTSSSTTGTTIFSPPSSPITLTSQGATSSDVKLLTAQSNRHVDNSSNAQTITVTNAPKIIPFSPYAPSASYSESVHGGSGFFEGNGNFLISDGSTDLALTPPYTLEAWVYPLTVASSSGEGNIIAVDKAAAVSGVMLGLQTDSIYLAKIGTGLNFPEIATTNNTHEWMHIAAVVNGTGSNEVSIYKNGVRIGQGTNNLTFSDSHVVAINADDRGNGEQTVFISSARVSNSARYSGTSYTIPTAPFTNDSNTKFLANFTNASIIDSTMKNNGETIADAQLDTTVKKFGTASMEFDGSGDYVRFHNNPFFTFGTGDFTIECFVYFNNTSGTQYICGQSHSDAGSDTSVQIYLDSGTTIYGWVGTSGKEVTASVFSATTWVHLAFVRQGANIRLYYDGVQQNSTNIGASYSPTVSTGPFSIGTVGNYSAGNLNAFIDEFRVTKGICRYPDGTSFTAPTKAFANK